MTFIRVPRWLEMSTFCVHNSERGKASRWSLELCTTLYVLYSVHSTHISACLPAGVGESSVERFLSVRRAADGAIPVRRTLTGGRRALGSARCAQGGGTGAWRAFGDGLDASCCATKHPFASGGFGSSPSGSHR